VGDQGAMRDRMVDAAVDLFRANGFDRTSMREIADKVGVTKPALYHHFASKDDLLVAVTKPIREAVDELLDKAEVERPTPGSFLVAYFDTIMKHRELAAWLSSDASARSRPVLAQHGWRQQERLTELLRGGDESFERGVRVSCALGAVQIGIIVYLAGGGLERARDEILKSALLILEAGT
jgi:AcrR family transcriptional regulator